MRKFSFFILSLVVFSISQATEDKALKTTPNPVLELGQWGAYVIDLESDEEIFSYQAKKLFIPASVTKLFTTAIALENLGPNYIFTTQVATEDLPDRYGILKGNICLKGSGDPTLDVSKLHSLAEQVYELGVRKILGTVCADDSLFHGVSLPIHSEWEDLPMDYSAEISALSLNKNVVQLVIKPASKINAKAQITVEQEVPYCTLVNNTLTTADKDSTAISVSRKLESNVIEVTGTIAAAHEQMNVAVAIHDPTEYVRQVFIKELESVGIKIMHQKISTKCAYDLARVDSEPLRDILIPMNKISDNFISEMLFKTVGAKLNPTKQPEVGAKEALGALFKKLAIRQNEYKIYDGSGLSRHNVITPQHAVKLLKWFCQCDFKNTLIESLPIAHKDGSLEQRFADNPLASTICGKTGGMSGISNLAGIALTNNGRKVLYCIFINNSPYGEMETNAALDFLLTQILNEKEVKTDTQT